MQSPSPSRPKRASPFAVALLLAFATVTSACHARNCWEALAAVGHYLGFRPHFSSASVRYKSVEADYAAVEKGLHGGNLIPLFRTGEQWQSYFQAGVNAFQGDPRRFVEVFGIKAARFFGFALIDSHCAHIPDFLEFSGALAAVNGELVRQGHDAVALGFFPTHGETGPTKYLMNFLQDLRIPMADEDTSQMHDLAFHSLAIFLPRDLLEHARRQTQILWEFLQYLKKMEKGEIPNSTYLARGQIGLAIRVLMMQRLVDLDTLTANMATAASILPFAEDIPKLARSHEIIDEELDFHLYKGLGPGGFLKLFLNKAPGRVDTSLFKSWRVQHSWWFFKWTTGVSQATLKTLAAGVASAYEPFMRERGVLPEDSQAYFQTADGLCIQMQERRGLIARIASELLDKQSTVSPGIVAP